MNENLGCISCSRGDPINICLAITLGLEHKIRYISFKDTSRLKALSGLIAQYELEKILVQKEHDFIITTLSNIKFHRLDRSEFKYITTLGFDYFTNCAISALLLYLNMPTLPIQQDFLENRCYIDDKCSEDFFKLVNNTVTKCGHRKLKLDVMQPLINCDEIKLRHDQMIYFRENNVLALKIDKILKMIPDVEKIILNDNIINNELNLLKKNIANVMMIGRFVHLYEILKKTSQLFKKDVTKLQNSISLLVNLQESENYDLADTFKFDKDEYFALAIKIYKESKRDLDLYIANAKFNFEFSLINYNKLNKVLKINNANFTRYNLELKNCHYNDKLSKTENSFFKASKTKTLDYKLSIKNSQSDPNKERLDIFNISNSLDLSHKMQNNLDPKISNENLKESNKIVLLSTKKDHVIATTKELQILNYKIIESYNQIIEIGGKICSKFLSDNKNDIKNLLDIVDEIAEIDVCLSSYKFSVKYDCCIPHIDDHICIQSSYHPLIKIEKKTLNDYFICNMLKFNVITGNNMNGKTAYMKQLYYQIVLNQIGYPIMAKAGTIKIFKHIYVKTDLKKKPTEILTFIQKIFVSPDTLLLIDEFGKGLGYDEIMATYITVFIRLIKSQAYILIVTHYRELIQYLDDYQCLNILKIDKYVASSGISKNMQIKNMCLDYLNLKIVNELENYKKKSIMSLSKTDDHIVNLAIKIQKSTNKSCEKFILKSLGDEVND